jgi:regulator of sigma E protease
MPAILQTVAVAVATYLPVVMVVVTVHEFGHFLVARAFGVAIDRFAIGFGRALVSWKDRGGVEWRIGWLPLGGYVKFSGDENAASVPNADDLADMRAAIIAREGPGAERRYLHFKPLWQRSLIILAGPAANFVLAIALFAVFFGVFGRPITSTRVSTVVPASAAAKAGFLPGDVLLSADGRKMDSFEDLQFYVQYRAGVPIDFALDRAGRLLHITARPAASSEPSLFGGVQTVGRIGLGAQGEVLQRCGPLEAIALGAAKTSDIAGATVFYLGRIVTGQVSADQLHSVIGIARASGAMTEQAVAMGREAGVSGFVAVSFFLLQLAGLISVSVGLLNLLPIPILDGGHLLFHAYEWVARRPAGAALQAAGYRVGLALLVGLMLFATWNDLDLQRLRVFHFFGSLFS